MRISSLGAEAVHWSIGNRHLLWDRSTSDWDRVAPILFPCVGWSRDGVVRINNRMYSMPVHGFAPSCRFALSARTDDTVIFELRESDVSLAHYPYSFRLSVLYALTPNCLRIELAVTNTGDDALPYACGIHPGFAWPFAGGSQADYEIRFAEPECPETPVISEGGLFSSRKRRAPLRGHSLRLTPSLFEREALCFLDARSREVCFAGPEGLLHARAEGFRHWALWSRPGAPFLCVEAWTGHGDPVGFAGEFADKPSIERLAPTETRSHALTLSYARSDPLLC